MRILIGYSMRSGSTLLQHMLGQHSAVRSTSDLSSWLMLGRLLTGLGPKQGAVCVKPMDILFLEQWRLMSRFFDRFIWLVRDPRDAYLSSIESGYAYLLWPRGRRMSGVDLGLVDRWQRIQRQYLKAPEKWHLVRYEDLVTRPEATMNSILEYLELPYERLDRFERFRLLNGGDYKICQSSGVRSSSVGRYRTKMPGRQRAVFQRLIGPEMDFFGYPSV